MTLTTEQLKHILDNPNEFSLSQVQEMAAELLANREAQPVGFYTTVSGRKGVIWHNGAPEDDTAIYTAPPAPAPEVPDDYQHLKNVQELYHSQEERLFSLAQRIKGVSFDKYSHTTAQAIDALEREIFGDDGGACRAAMLQNSASGEPSIDAGLMENKRENSASVNQPVSSGYTFNSPVIPDGWIACSERMPDADGAYWCWFGKEIPSVIQQRVCIWNDRNHEWCDSAVTHWMPLPAAPEGGNG